jgi:hypothetical protein
LDSGAAILNLSGMGEEDEDIGCVFDQEVEIGSRRSFAFLCLPEPLVAPLFCRRWRMWLRLSLLR